MIAQFALRLIVGMSLMWACMPRRDVTSGFFRIQMLVTLGLGVLAALTVGQLSGTTTVDGSTASFAAPLTGLSITIAVVSFFGSVLWMLERRLAGTAAAFLICGFAVAALLVSALKTDDMIAGQTAMILLAEFTSAAMVGGFLTAMLLGHWYLTAPTMTIRPLSRLNLLLAFFTAGRFAVSVAGLLLGVSLLTSQTQWLWLTLRWGAGIIGPAILVLMVYRILKYRNTQSATGVLFVGVILTFIGELSATLLFASLLTAKESGAVPL